MSYINVRRGLVALVLVFLGKSSSNVWLLFRIAFRTTFRVIFGVGFKFVHQWCTPDINIKMVSRTHIFIKSFRILIEVRRDFLLQIAKSKYVGLRLTLIDFIYTFSLYFFIIAIILFDAYPSPNGFLPNTTFLETNFLTLFRILFLSSFFTKIP